jgi:hypothetical protein
MKKKKFDKYNLIATISVFFTFVMIVIVTIYSYTSNKNKVVEIILFSLLGVFALTTIFCVIKFLLGTPRLKNK